MLYNLVYGLPSANYHRFQNSRLIEKLSQLFRLFGIGQLRELLCYPIKFEKRSNVEILDLFIWPKLY